MYPPQGPSVFHTFKRSLKYIVLNLFQLLKLFILFKYISLINVASLYASKNQNSVLNYLHKLLTD